MEYYFFHFWTGWVVVVGKGPTVHSLGMPGIWFAFESYLN